MMIRAIFAFALTMSVNPVSLRADEEPAKTQPSRVVGSVYGKPVTSTDIGLTGPIDPAIRFDATNSEKWELMGRVMQAFGGPVLDRFVAQRKIDATGDEMKAFRDYSRRSIEKLVRELDEKLQKLKTQLAAPDLADPIKADLEKERAGLEQSVLQMRETLKVDEPKDLGRALIVSWKVERELHRQYGGRVIFQQFGAEALDARRLLFEEAEKKGDLKFADAGVRHLFYYYANMKHTAIDAKYLEERPWFLGDGR
jgi:hypothetical protein